MIDRKVILGGKQSSGLSLATISLVLSEKAPFSDKNLTMCVFFSGIDLWDLTHLRYLVFLFDKC